MPTPRGFCPFAVNRNIPPGDNDPVITPRVAILHVDAGNAESLFNFFNGPSGGVESHFHITRTGVIEQYRSIYFQADANLLANDFAVSIETQGFGDGEWTPDQLAAIKRLLRWLHTEAGIPLVKCQKWDGFGVGYHTLFGSPSQWTPLAKSCPGPARIRQFNLILVPWMDQMGDTGTIPPKKPKPSKVQQARVKIREAIDLLAGTLPSRKGARAEIPNLRKIRRRLPKE